MEQINEMPAFKNQDSPRSRTMAQKQINKQTTNQPTNKQRKQFLLEVLNIWQYSKAISIIWVLANGLSLFTI